MTSPDRATEQVTDAIYRALHRDTDPYSVPLERMAQKAARDLQEKGLIAVAPLDVSAAWADGYAAGYRARRAGQQYSTGAGARQSEQSAAVSPPAQFSSRTRQPDRRPD
ncbi:hypothetical protein M3G04_01295 [Dietzia cinnamea]|uniref:hypothetical protein n=1 Tax=Dietzia cinnamea TaxID=321318 RepID=UPI00223AAA16|nr:hypothetical protein [Dietzia cinnamea]MCT2299547.1 hypothetical protein [Dietzia cinnamea]